VKLQKLITTITHKRNTSLLCDGVTYEIDELGIVEVPPKVAAKLLQNVAWVPLSTKGAAGKVLAARTKTRAERIEEHKTNSKVVLANGAVISPREHEALTAAEKEAEQIDAEMEKSLDAIAPAQPSDDDAEAAEKVLDGTADGTPEASAVDDANEWPSPGSDAYPDPSVDLPVETLQRMAADYQIEFTPRTKATTLVKRLTEVMYED